MSKPKKITLQRLGRNLGRIARSLTPPVLQRVLGLTGKSTLANEPSPQDSSSDSRNTATQAEFLIPQVPSGRIWDQFDLTEVTMLPRQLRDHLWAMPENELLVLSTICQLLKPQRVFEFGTFTGASTLAIAANTPAETEIHTLDIPPSQRRLHRTGVGSDIPFDYEVGEVFRGTPWENKITIHHDDSRHFDTSDLQGQMDLVFVDADHTYEFAHNDTAKALEMLAPGGSILWHDYRWDDQSPECAGVTQVVNEFHSSRGTCLEIAGTRFAIFRSGAAVESEVAA